MREPIKIETETLRNSLPETVQVKSANVPSKDNISHITAVIDNLLRDMSDEGFLFALKLLQLATEKADELKNKR